MRFIPEGKQSPLHLACPKKRLNVEVLRTVKPPFHKGCKLHIPLWIEYVDLLVTPHKDIGRLLVFFSLFYIVPVFPVVPKCGLHRLCIFPKVATPDDSLSESSIWGLALWCWWLVFNRILLHRMNDAVESQFRDQQAGFRKDQSCTNEIATLCIIQEQSLECNSSFYSFLDYEKAFDSVDRGSL
jgi:hypothetical protein